MFPDESGESKHTNKVSTPVIMSFWFNLAVNITVSKIIYKISHSQDTQKWHQNRRTASYEQTFQEEGKNFILSSVHALAILQLG